MYQKLVWYITLVHDCSLYQQWYLLQNSAQPHVPFDMSYFVCLKLWPVLILLHYCPALLSSEKQLLTSYFAQMLPETCLFRWNFISKESSLESKSLFVSKLKRKPRLTGRIYSAKHAVFQFDRFSLLKSLPWLHLPTLLSAYYACYFSLELLRYVNQLWTKKLSAFLD